MEINKFCEKFENDVLYKVQDKFKNKNNSIKFHEGDNIG